MLQEPGSPLKRDQSPHPQGDLVLKRHAVPAKDMSWQLVAVECFEYQAWEGLIEWEVQLLGRPFEVAQKLLPVSMLGQARR